MQFMMLMIPAVYQGGKKVDPGFVPDPKKMEEMAKFNEELGKAVKIISLNGLHPLATAALKSAPASSMMANSKPGCDSASLRMSSVAVFSTVALGPNQSTTAP